MWISQAHTYTYSEAQCSGVFSNPSIHEGLALLESSSPTVSDWPLPCVHWVVVTALPVRGGSGAATSGIASSQDPPLEPRPSSPR